MAIKIGSFWAWAGLSVAFRLALIGFADVLNFGSRPEIATPLTSLRRLAEGYWLKQSSMSPYAGSMYHGSPLLLSLLGPLTAKRIGGQSNQVLACLLFVIADFSTAMLIRAIGYRLQLAYSNSLTYLGISKLKTTSSVVAAGDVSALIYLWNPMTIVTCLGYSSTPFDNLMVILSIYGACEGLVPLAAFGWVMASHLSLYPMVLVIPVVLLLGFGPDSPPRKLFCTKVCQPTGADLSKARSDQPNEFRNQHSSFMWRPVLKFMLWASVWSMYVFGLCAISLNDNGGLPEMFSKTYGFILTVPDLSPNIGVLWYFFAEVFDSFRVFFLLVFHMNIIYMILPLAIRLNHRPCFLAFLYIVVYSMLKSYPSVGDSALYLGLLGLFINELSDMHLSYFLFCGYIGVSLLSPVMHNLWIWRGTGNANFYFATAIAYACLQIILLVEGVSSMLKHDRLLKGKALSESS